MSIPADSTPLPPLPPSTGGGSYLDWSVHIRVKKHEFAESFTVFIFLGDVPNDSDEWYSSPSYVGDHNVMVFRYGSQPNTDEDTYVQGVVHLNKAIVARSGLQSLDEDVVVPYLKENLAWRVRTIAGECVELDGKTSLETTVFNVRVSMRPGGDSSTLPSHGEPHYYHQITAGRPGGARTE